jgi:phage FluMu protein Com
MAVYSFKCPSCKTIGFVQTDKTIQVTSCKCVSDGKNG